MNRLSNKMVQYNNNTYKSLHYYFLIGNCKFPAASAKYFPMERFVLLAWTTCDLCLNIKKT